MRVGPALASMAARKSGRQPRPNSKSSMRHGSNSASIAWIDIDR